VHTTNPVPLLAVGPAAATFSRARSITDVAGLVMEVLGG
jgi:bisphosphoglycerate-independent phosphoglycerate mutase (AlkP superfamily)